MANDRQLLVTAVGLLRRLRDATNNENLYFEAVAFLDSYDSALATAPREASSTSHAYTADCGRTYHPTPAAAAMALRRITDLCTEDDGTTDTQVRIEVERVARNALAEAEPPPAAEYHAIGGNPPPEVLEAVRAAYPAVARGEQTAEELRARIVRQGRNQVRFAPPEALDYLRSFVDWIEAMDRDATVTMETRPHRWVGAGDYGGSAVGQMCGDCGVDSGDDAAERPCGPIRMGEFAGSPEAADAAASEARPLTEASETERGR